MSSSSGRMCSSSRSSPAEARLEQLIHIPRIPSDATGAGPSSATTSRKGPCRHSTPRTYSRTASHDSHTHSHESEVHHGRAVSNCPYLPVCDVCDDECAATCELCFCS